MLKNASLVIEVKIESRITPFGKNESSWNSRL